MFPALALLRPGYKWGQSEGGGKLDTSRTVYVVRSSQT